MGLAARIADRLVSVSGVLGVGLGGSRTRFTHLPDSDLELGRHYESTLDLSTLRPAPPT